jgi:hypothetical protein
LLAYAHPALSPASLRQEQLVNRILALVGGTALVGLAAAAMPAAPSVPLAKGVVMVHCSNGNNAAFVTPARLSIVLGDSVEWRMAGNVVSDSLIISPKNPDQAWPFDGTPSRGGASAVASGAKIVGTYSYNVTLLCRLPGGGTRQEVIDPDIIIGS